jgi:hypothetical protein
VLHTDHDAVRQADQTLILLAAPRRTATSSAGGQPATASAVIGFAVHHDDLGQLSPVIGAARADRLAWIGYPKAGKPQHRPQP